MKCKNKTKKKPERFVVGAKRKKKVFSVPSHSAHFNAIFKMYGIKSWHKPLRWNDKVINLHNFAAPFKRWTETKNTEIDSKCLQPVNQMKRRKKKTTQNSLVEEKKFHARFTAVEVCYLYQIHQIRILKLFRIHFRYFFFFFRLVHVLCLFIQSFHLIRSHWLNIGSLHFKWMVFDGINAKA